MLTCLPAVDGRMVLRRILERKPEQAVLILSALTDTPTRSRPSSWRRELPGQTFSLAELRRACWHGCAASPFGRRAGSGGKDVTDLVRREADQGNGPIPLGTRVAVAAELMQTQSRAVEGTPVVRGAITEPGSNVVDVT
jgi:hypothetical protein